MNVPNVVRRHAPSVARLFEDFHPGLEPLADMRRRDSRLAKAQEEMLDVAEREGRGLSNSEAEAFDAITKRREFVQEWIEKRGPKDPLVAAILDGQVSGNRSARGFDDEPAGSGWVDSKSGREVRVLERGDSFREAIGRNDHDEPGFRDFGSCARALLLGPRDAAEARALSEGTPSAGGYTVPTPLAAEVIDALRARSVAFQAGCRTVPMAAETLTIAKVATDPAASWRLEAGAVAESDPTFGAVELRARSLAVRILVSRELAEDSPNLSDALTRAIAGSMAAEVDRVIFTGSGVAPEPAGIVEAAGINEVATVGAITSYGPLVQAIGRLKTSNAPDATAFVMHPRTWEDFALLADSTGQPLAVPPAIQSIPMLTTTGIPIDLGAGTDSLAIAGHFPDCLVGVRSELRLEILRERYSDNLQLGFLAFLRMDVAVARAGSFCKLTGISA